MSSFAYEHSIQGIIILTFAKGSWQSNRFIQSNLSPTRYEIFVIEKDPSTLLNPPNLNITISQESEEKKTYTVKIHEMGRLFNSIIIQGASDSIYRIIFSNGRYAARFEQFLLKNPVSPSLYLSLSL